MHYLTSLLICPLVAVLPWDVGAHKSGWPGDGSATLGIGRQGTDRFPGFLPRSPCFAPQGCGLWRGDAGPRAGSGECWWVSGWQGA